MSVGVVLPERLACIVEGMATEHEKHGSYDAGVALRGAARAARNLTDARAEAILSTMDPNGPSVRLRDADLYGKTGEQVLEMLARKD
ncbi:MAG TPA: hypothetical protein VHV82_03880 [Sporichthyaceae bacterium]|jgi:hypothetical protein|nr:hypothetical protein [Sporichthyaceae bacterium]